MSKCHEDSKEVLRTKGRSIDDWGYPLNYETVECVKNKGISPAVAEALESVMSTAANYGSDYAFEFAPRNLATDDQGNLVLLDVVFSLDARKAQLREKRKKDDGSWLKRLMAGD